MNDWNAADLVDQFAGGTSGPASGLRLQQDSRVGVVGGGPAGSFFSYFLLTMARRTGLDVRVDVYEPRDFSNFGPGGCNHCGGIVSESLVQALATEGVNLPEAVVQRGIDSYVLHMDVGSVRIETPLHEKRIAAVYRGSGPKGTTEAKWGSFDGYLQSLAASAGARIIHQRVGQIAFEDERPVVRTIGRDKTSRDYDLVAVAVGVNSGFLKSFQNLDFGYQPPRTTRTFICEFRIGEDQVRECLGSSMHVFLLNLPRLEFAALIPKGDHISLCLLGDSIDQALVRSFLGTPEVRKCFPPEMPVPERVCNCAPQIAVGAATRPYANRMVLIGDCGVTRLYKDGIGAAYRTAKAAARTAVFEGISAEDFKRSYGPTCRSLDRDNWIGKLIFLVTRQVQNRQFARRAVLRMTAREQSRGERPRLSGVLWDVFTGSAPYREVFLRTLHPAFLSRLSLNLLLGFFSRGGAPGATRRTTA